MIIKYFKFNLNYNIEFYILVKPKVIIYLNKSIDILNTDIFIHKFIHTSNVCSFMFIYFNKSKNIKSFIIYYYIYLLIYIFKLLYIINHKN